MTEGQHLGVHMTEPDSFPIHQSTFPPITKLMCQIHALPTGLKQQPLIHEVLLWTCRVRQAAFGYRNFR
jgi:hypothetical protein